MNNFEIITTQIQKGGEISPFLFLSQNIEILQSDIYSFILSVLKQYNIDEQSLFHIADSPEAIKIDEIKKFLSAWEIKPRFAFQVFLIENISRMTTQAQNSCLKFFEEPWEGNIIILTNSSESGILETILSRVSIIQFSPKGRNEAMGDDFYYSMIETHIQKSSDELVRYMFGAKLEKSDYFVFLKTLIEYISKTWEFISLLDELHEDINGILNNNLQGKYIVDKYIMKLVHI